MQRAGSMPWHFVYGVGHVPLAAGFAAMIGPLTYLDVALLAVLFIFGLLGMRRGLRLALVSWPIRWIVSLFGGYLAKIFVVLQLARHKELADRLGATDQMGLIIIGAITFFAGFIAVLLVMRSVRRRILDRIYGRGIGIIERGLGGAFGVACGLFLIVWLVVLPYMQYKLFRPDTRMHPAWLRESKSLPYIEAASDSIMKWISRYIPSKPAPTIRA
jgi:membrane protein required for colicin V production